jgi:hypothetical protein
MERWTVRLPTQVRGEYAVFVNGVRQREGVDYDVRDRELRFSRPLVRAQRLGFWRWFWGAFGIGTYRRDDQVDVTWEADGRPQVAHALDITPPS